MASTAREGRRGGRAASQGSVEKRRAMARGHGDAPLGVERDDRRSVKCRSHMAVLATFSYLLPLYGQRARRSSVKDPTRQ